MDNKFDLYSSKVRRVNIPLPSFRFFHKASSDEEVDPKFIGRKKLSDKLYSWLVNDDKRGSYLVTGFRGMGKSSFVGRVLNELTQKVSSEEFIKGILFFVFLFAVGVSLIPVIFEILRNYHIITLTLPLDIISLVILIAWVSFSILNIEAERIKESESIFIGFPIIGLFALSLYFHFSHISLLYKVIFLIILIIFLYIVYKIPSILYKAQYEDRKNHKDFKSLLKEEYREITESKKELFKEENIDWKRACRILHSEYTRNRSYQRICISVNLGQEVLNERDVLSLISHQLYTKYREYVLSPIANFPNWLFYTFIILLSVYPSCFLFYKRFAERELYTTEIKECVILLLMPIAIIFAIYFVSQLFSSSQTRILRRLHLLNNRLDAQVSFNEAYTAGIGDPSQISPHSSAGYTKKRSYDIAKVREIEQELIDVLNSISKTFRKNKKSPSFIFVFDELDKVDSSSLQGYAFDNQTEFSNEKNFPGGGTTRHRKKNVLHLLANMKLFISTAKAKFIFISGRELYDAYLADLSDREFAVSSIFSGVIYVDSFCVNEYKRKEVMSNVEMYICKQLMPKEYINKLFAHQYIDELKKESFHEPFDINLRMYRKYLLEQYELDEEDNDIQKILYSRYIDKTINLLYHFSVYLYHISNGSPKKMMLHFEKYVRTAYEKDKSYFSKITKSKFTIDPREPIYIFGGSEIEYYLSFGYMDQRTIGFIHYISFPINQILVNANQYSDKLLVSVSFLIDHIYKFHNGGFSWRNLEYTPELLEVYKIPGFRNFINSIISYLQQAHIVSISCGLYQFKFRKRIAEEISLASRISEEIAALFNFTLDESRNVKQHYFDIREAYLTLEGKGNEHTPRLNIGLHNILGDLYMFDEEINNAILEYHAAINELGSEMEAYDKNEPNLDNMLYLIRLLLKLGLANEKRKTNESALLTYNNLVSKLLGFRHFNEQDLQLTYRLRKSGEWPSYEGVIFPKKDDRGSDYDFNMVHPKIISGSDQIYKKNTEFMASGQQLSNVFAHLITPEKYSIIQRISLFQDIRLVYQALLAKLFVKEKMNLGGITLTDLEIIESEYLYLNLASNVKEKFLTSSDFFRRLGDIMYYKNGLTASEYDDSFVEGLSYWGVDIKREILDYCNINKSYQRYKDILNLFYRVRNQKLEEVISDTYLSNVFDVFDQIMKSPKFKELGIKPFQFDNRLKYISTKKVLDCNKHRIKMFKKNRPVPCHACKYYNRSLRTLMKGMFDCDIFQEQMEKNTNNVFIVLKKILEKGTSRSLRQEYVIQLAEILDCKGNIQLSCTCNEEDNITSKFMDAFFEDIEKSESLPETSYFSKEECNSKSSKLFSTYIYDENEKPHIHKLEESILYYWEASICFAIGNDLMKASASLKKIMHILQNYLKTVEDIPDSQSRKEFVSVYIEKLKKYIIKPCLVYLYSHYNNINIAEIRILQWIYDVQTYENIPLSRLSLFPDVEHLMILYYDLLRRCNLEQTGETSKLSIIYRHSAFSSLRQESTTYERVMSLRFRVLMNFEFLKMIFGEEQEIFYQFKTPITFIGAFFNYINPKETLENKLIKYKDSFGLAFACFEKESISDFAKKLQFLEFLTKDSLYCITRIIEILTPRSTTTLFTNSFYGETYQMLYEWTYLFYRILNLYRSFDTYIDNSNKNEAILLKDRSRIHNKIDSLKMGQNIQNYKKIIKSPFSIYFFNGIMQLLGKTQVNYTMIQYPISMAVESYKNALEMHHEGKTYKELISQMYYLDDDLKNDTISFGSAVERYKINTGYIGRQLEKFKNKPSSLFDIENFGKE